MTSRERVLTALSRREPDRVPFNLRTGPELVARLRAEVGDVDFAVHFGHDVRYVSLPLPTKPEGLPDCEWMPEPNEADIAAVRAATEALHAQDVAVCGSYFCGVYEQAKHWLGDEATMVGPYEDPVGFARVLDRITAWKASLYSAYAAAGVDLVWMGDDLGTQRALVMSPALYRAWYRPRHEAIIAAIRRESATARIAFHCCGHVTPLVGDLIDIGLDVLEAVQPEAMDLSTLKREFGRDISFWGGVGAQHVLQGTPEEVRAGVRETLRIMAPGGGYIAAPCHTLTDDVPWESVLVFHEVLRDEGAYPLRFS